MCGGGGVGNDVNNTPLIHGQVIYLLAVFVVYTLHEITYDT